MCDVNLILYPYVGKGGNLNDRWRKEQEAGENCLVMAVPLHSQQAQRGGRSIALPILDLGASSGWPVNTMPRPL
jgi:hypothetical protein